MPNKSRSYPFTINNYTEDELATLNSLPIAELNIRYICFGKEIAPETGTPHLQGYIYLVNPRTMVALHRIPGLARAHFVVGRGSPDSNRDYCMKPNEEGGEPKILGEDFFELGNLPAQGMRNDLQQAAVEFVESGYNMGLLAQSKPDIFIKFHNGFRQMAQLQFQTQRNWKTKVLWLCGPTGTGKSRAAASLSSDDLRLYYKDPTNKWWDGYTDQQVAVVDDYRQDMCTFATLLRLFDRYPMPLEVKGGQVQCRFKWIIVTCPKSPGGTEVNLFIYITIQFLNPHVHKLLDDLWSTRTEEQLAQLMRRIEYVIPFPMDRDDTDQIVQILKDIKTDCLGEDSSSEASQPTETLMENLYPLQRDISLLTAPDISSPIQEDTRTESLGGGGVTCAVSSKLDNFPPSATCLFAPIAEAQSRFRPANSTSVELVSSVPSQHSPLSVRKRVMNIANSAWKKPKNWPLSEMASHPEFMAQCLTGTKVDAKQPSQDDFDILANIEYLA